MRVLVTTVGFRYNCLSFIYQDLHIFHHNHNPAARFSFRVRTPLELEPKILVDLLEKGKEKTPESLENQELFGDFAGFPGHHGEPFPVFQRNYYYCNVSTGLIQV